MTRKNLALTIATVLFSLAVTTNDFADEAAPRVKNAPASTEPKPALARPVLVTISKETTYVTGPLRKDGYVDYVAALNERCSKGVTAENNFAVPFWKAVGPAGIDKAKRDTYFKLLGIMRIPDDGTYFVPFDDFVAKERTAANAPGDVPATKDTEEPRRLEDFDLSRPLSAKEFPILARWLDANEQPLTILVERSKRPRHFDPLVAIGSEGVIEAATPPIKTYREIADALMLHGMLKISKGKIDEAWRDFLAVHRLGRLVAQGPTILYAIVGRSIDGLACMGDQAVLQHADLSDSKAKEMRNELSNLPSLPSMADYVDSGERFMMLDAAASVARGSVTLQALAGPQPKFDPAEMEKIDWDTILRMSNPWYDRMSAALRMPTRSQRKEACEKIKRDFKALVAKYTDKTSIAISALTNPRDGLSRRMGMFLLALFELDLNSFIEAEDRAAMQFEVTKLGFALAAYHDEHGSYPLKFAELVPKYAAEIPKDRFNAEELHYKQIGNGYLLYSVGPNGIDDGGKGYADRRNTEDWDDLSIRVYDSAKSKRGQ
jgi:hypothetical protein